MNLVTYAYFLAIDFLVNVLYTLVFASLWFFMVSNSNQTAHLDANASNRAQAVSGSVDPILTNSTLAATPFPSRSKAQLGNLVGGMGPANLESPGQMLSTISIIIFWVVKLYMVFIVFSYARSVVIRNHITFTSLSVPSNSWGRVQRWMLSGDYWAETEDDYKQER